jgi:hypothetical protein
VEVIVKMELSKSLAKQFAQITNDEKPSSGEATAYGVVKKVAGDTFVKLDGSELLTPVTATVSVKDGERAVVTIKNHSAMITSNLDDPSASTQDLKGITEEYDSITGQLTAITIAVNDNYIRIDQMGNTINGLTTFTNGLQNGTTKINGGCLETNSITADKIVLTGSISFADLSTDVADELDYAVGTAEEALELAENFELPNYIQSTYIDKTTVKSPKIMGNSIESYGGFKALDANSNSMGFFGGATGLDGQGNITSGVALAASGSIDSESNLIDITTSRPYIIVTTAGARMQADTNDHVCVIDGSTTVTAAGNTFVVNGNGLYYNGKQFYSASTGLIAPSGVAVYS